MRNRLRNAQGADFYSVSVWFRWFRVFGDSHTRARLYAHARVWEGSAFCGTAEPTILIYIIHRVSGSVSGSAWFRCGTTCHRAAAQGSNCNILAGGNAPRWIGHFVAGLKAANSTLLLAGGGDSFRVFAWAGGDRAGQLVRGENGGILGFLRGRSGGVGGVALEGSPRRPGNAPFVSAAHKLRRLVRVDRAAHQSPPMPPSRRLSISTMVAL